MAGALYMPASLHAGLGDISAPRPEASPEQVEQDFRERCIGSMKRQDYAAATEWCERFTRVDRWAGKAHAALTAIYLSPYRPDPDAAYEHAQQAVRLGDPHGKYMAAMLMLQNRSRQPPDLAQAMQWLSDAVAAKTYGAVELRDKVQASLDCRGDGGSFRLLGEPLFCLLGAEVGQALMGKGFSRSGAYSPDWKEVWRVTDVLPIANQAQAFFDQGADGVSRLASFVYRAQPDRYAQLESALIEKYGAPRTVDRRRGVRVWQLAQGVELQLAQADDAVEVRYTLPERMRSREEHLKQQALLDAAVQRKREALAL
jgi:TPR repeat protein